MVMLVARCFNCRWGTEPEDADLVLDQALDHSCGPCGGPVLVLSPADPTAAEVWCRDESFPLAKGKQVDD